MGLGPSSAIYCLCNLRKGFPGGSDGKKICPQCGRLGFDPWVGKTPWIREQQPMPIFLSGEFHGQRSLADYSPWSHRVGHDCVTDTHNKTLGKSPNTTQPEAPHLHFFTFGNKDFKINTF